MFSLTTLCKFKGILMASSYVDDSFVNSLLIVKLVGLGIGGIFMLWRIYVVLEEDW